MKKILLLATVMMLFATVGLMADVTFSGDVRTRAAVEGDDTDGSTTDIRIRLNLAASIDDYNRANARIVHDAEGDASFDRAHATTDLGAWLGGEFGVELPIGITYNIGLNEFSYADVADNTSYGFEALQNIDDITAVGSKLNISVMDMGNVYFAHAFEGWYLPASQRVMLTGADLGIDVGVGTVMAEVVYSAIGTEVAGDLGVGLAFTSEGLVEGMSGTVGASMTFPLDSDNEDTMYYGVGAGIAYTNLVWADVSFLGGVYDSDSTEDMWLGMALGSDPVDFFSFGSGLVLWLGGDEREAANDDSKDAEVLDSAEVYGQLHAGAMTFTLGYYWVNDAAAAGVDGDGNPTRGAGQDLQTPTTAFRNVYFTADVSF